MRLDDFNVSSIKTAYDYLSDYFCPIICPITAVSPRSSPLRAFRAEVPPRETSPASRSVEKRMFSKAIRFFVRSIARLFVHNFCPSICLIFLSDILSDYLSDFFISFYVPLFVRFFCLIILSGSFVRLSVKLS